MTALETDSGRRTPARLAGSAILALQSDERLVKLVRSGHERAFEAIVERYRKPLVRFCAGILPESRTEDAVQQAFINAHAALLASDEAVQLKPWLYAITRNAALNMLRQNGWNYEQIPLDFDGVRRPDQIFEQRADLERTVAAMNELPERQREALVMREFEGRSYDEIAVALGANDGAVRQLLNRARVTLRSAAAAIIPAPLVARAAASMPPADGRRVAELLGGIGTAGIAKAGATALVAGSLVVGAVEAPIVSKEKTTHEKATLSADKPAAKPAPAAAVAAHDTPVSLRATAAPAPAAPAKARAEDRQGPSHESGSNHSGSDDRSESRQQSGSDDRSRSGGDDTRERSGSGSDDDTTSHSGSGEDHSGSSRESGSDDRVTSVVQPAPTTTAPDSSGSGSSGSGGSDDATTDSSGHSGSDDPVTTETDD